jgi:hypothetical protein
MERGPVAPNRGRVLNRLTRQCVSERIALAFACRSDDPCGYSFKKRSRMVPHRRCGGHPSALAVCQVAYEAKAGNAYVLSIARIELLGESQHFICDRRCRVRQSHF